jgi:hypothetical protein
MIAEAAAELPISAPAAWALANRTSVQLYLSRGFFSYVGEDELPSHRKQGYEASLRLKLFGLVPLWIHHQRFSRVDTEHREILVEEWGAPYGRWTHRMSIDVLGSDRCRCVDQIEISAGWRTPVVWLFAVLLCRKRMARLRELTGLLVD